MKINSPSCALAEAIGPPPARRQSHALLKKNHIILIAHTKIKINSPDDAVAVTREHELWRFARDGVDAAAVAPERSRGFPGARPHVPQANAACVKKTKTTLAILIAHTYKEI